MAFLNRHYITYLNLKHSGWVSTEKEGYLYINDFKYDDFQQKSPWTRAVGNAKFGNILKSET